MAAPTRVRSNTPGVLIGSVVIALVLGAVLVKHSSSSTSSGSVSSTSVGSTRTLPSAGFEEIHSYDVTMTINSDASLLVSERIDYDFGSYPKHGIHREIPVEYPYDKSHLRVYKVDHITVSSDAPSQTKKSISNHQLVLRIGDPNRTVSGRHVYTITYLVHGALNAYADHVELDWNAIGTEWPVRIEAGSASVKGPALMDSLACFVGPLGSRKTCPTSGVATAQTGKPAGSSSLTYSSGTLSSGYGMTVAISMPVTAVAASGTTPILKEKFSLDRAFARSPAAVTIALLLLVGGVLLLTRLLTRAGRDRRYTGLTPGLLPPGADSTSAPTALAPMRGGPEAAVAFTPPKGLRPGQLGTLIDERADVADVTASVVDLAVRGYLTIEEIPREGLFGRRDWKLKKLKSASETDSRGEALQDFEIMLHNSLFSNDSKDEVLISDLKDHFAGDLAKVRDRLYDDVVSQGWFRRRPDRVRSSWSVMGLVATGAGVAATVFLARSTHLALIGLPVVLLGLVILASAHRMPARTAKGSAVLAQTLGFRTYLRTAELDQIKFEERADVFSRYLPYAMVFGEADRWTKVIGPAVTASAPGVGGGSTGIGFLPWYIGPSGWNIGDLGPSLDSFASTAGSTFQATPASSGGGFGGGGGFSGGGGGGGGGGSW